MWRASAYLLEDRTCGQAGRCHGSCLGGQERSTPGVLTLQAESGGLQVPAQPGQLPT